MTTAMAFVAVGCVAGPQPEPPDDPHTPRDGGAGRGPDAPPPTPPDPPAAIDASAPRPAADAGPAFMGEPPPWLDPDEVPDSRNDGVAPFPFEPCCGWFVLPEASSDAGADADADAGGDVDAGPDVDADSTD